MSPQIIFFITKKLDVYHSFEFRTEDEGKITGVFFPPIFTEDCVTKRHEVL